MKPRQSGPLILILLAIFLANFALLLLTDVAPARLLLFGLAEAVAAAAVTLLAWRWEVWEKEERDAERRERMTRMADQRADAMDGLHLWGGQSAMHPMPGANESTESYAMRVEAWRREERVRAAAAVPLHPGY